jgi:hypothetical protein
MVEIMQDIVKGAIVKLVVVATNYIPIFCDVRTNFDNQRMILNSNYGFS